MNSRTVTFAAAIAALGFLAATQLTSPTAAQSGSTTDRLPTTIPEPHPSTRCGAPTAVRPGSVVKLGPIAFPGRSMGGHVEIRLNPGHPTKILLTPVRRLVRTVVIRGIRCSDGKPLRFKYNDQELPAPPLSTRQLETLGTAAGYLRPYPYPLSRGTRIGYAGYMLFTQTGTWKLTATQSGRRVGSLVVLVAPIAGA